MSFRPIIVIFWKKALCSKHPLIWKNEFKVQSSASKVEIATSLPASCCHSQVQIWTRTRKVNILSLWVNFNNKVWNPYSFRIWSARQNQKPILTQVHKCLSWSRVSCSQIAKRRPKKRLTTSGSIAGSMTTTRRKIVCNLLRMSKESWQLRSLKTTIPLLREKMIAHPICRKVR